MRPISRVALSIVLFSLGCSHFEEPGASPEVAEVAASAAEVAASPTAVAENPSEAAVSKKEELLWSLSENGRFELLESYDRAQRIVYISRSATPQFGFDTSPSKLAYLFDHGALPYQFDGTDWVALWSPFQPPDLEEIE